VSFVQPDQNEIIWCINCRQFDFCTWESNFPWLTLERSPRLREHPGFLMNVAGEWRGFNRNGEMACECCLIGLGPGPDPAFLLPPTLVAARESAVLYETAHHPSLGGEPVLLILTNADGAEDFKVAVAPLALKAAQPKKYSIRKNVA